VGVVVARGLLGGLGVVLMVGGIALMALPGPKADILSALFVFLPGAVLVTGVLLERTRYRSLKAERTGDGHGPGGGEPARPSDRFRPTDERFVDPTTGTPMRVWIDPSTGDRRYVAEA
jgi:hypothetical protein